MVELGRGGLERTPVKTLDSPRSEISGGSPADNSSTRGLLLLPRPHNQGRRCLIRGHNRAISQLSSGVAKEGIQRRLAVDRDDDEEVAGLVVADVDVDGRVGRALKVGGRAPTGLARAVGDIGEVAGVDAAGVVVGDLELVVAAVCGVVAGADEALEGPGALSAGVGDCWGGSGERSASEGKEG